MMNFFIMETSSGERKMGGEPCETAERRDLRSVHSSGMLGEVTPIDESASKMWRPASEEGGGHLTSLT